MSFNRAELKSRAKDFLRDHYIYAFIVCLIVVLICGNRDYISFNFDFSIDHSTEWQYLFPGVFRLIFGLPLFVIAFFVSVGINIFLMNPLRVSLKRYFIGGNYSSVSDLLYSYRSPYFLNIVKTCFVRDVIVIIHFFFLVIPGIIKTYQYSQVDYILAEHPEYSTSEILRISSEMTDGNKGDMFVLSLSFIGWHLVGSLVFGLVNYLLEPYYEATYAQLYLELKSAYGWTHYDYVDEDFD